MSNISKKEQARREAIDNEIDEATRDIDTNMVVFMLISEIRAASDRIIEAIREPQTVEYTKDGEGYLATTQPRDAAS